MTGLVASLLFAGAAQAQGPMVRIDAGALQGASVTPTVVSFKGIPYAKPPVGALRWTPPQRPDGWSAPREATAFGAPCPQPGGSGPLDGSAKGMQSEDCLTLNVWAPVGAKAAPVMVWLHGGGNTQGGSSIPYYDGSAFARDGVVLVSINYRLGALGFFAHPAITKAAGRGEALGNYGLMDQVAALEWVKRNIAAFGGDPKAVTVFGESAGGQDILLLMGNRAAPGLFKQAIVESGGGWDAPPSLATREAQGEAAVAASGSPNATIEQLRALPTTTLGSAAFRGAFGPMLDGRLIKTSASKAFARGDAMDVPLIIGSNEGEDSLMGSAGGAAILERLPAGSLETVRAVYGGVDDKLLAKNLFRDSVMGAPAHWLAGKTAGGAPTYLYQFTYVPPTLKAFLPRAAHGQEVLFVFETLDKSPIPASTLSKEDFAFAHTVHTCWVTFAKTGTPSCPPAPEWPRYSQMSDPTMMLSPQIEVKSGYLKGPYRMQEAAYAKRGGPGSAAR